MNYGNLKNKKILLMCKETYSYPLFFLAKKLLPDNEVAAFFVHSSECSYNKCYFNENSYYKFLEELPEVNMYDVKEICLTFAKNYKNPSINMDFLKKVEKEYTHFKNLNLQLMTSQMTTRYYHYRNYYVWSSYEQNMYWLQLNYENCIRIMEDFRPDFILDYQDEEIARNIMIEVAYKNQVPYISVEHPRYAFYKYPTYILGTGLDSYFKVIYEKKKRLSREELKEAYAYIEDYRKKTDIMPPEFKGTSTASYERDSLLWVLRVMRGKWNYFWNQDITKKNRKLKKSCPMIFSPSIPYIYFYFRLEMRKRKLFKKNKYFHDPVEGENYVYMPLHLIPESATVVKTPFYLKELEVIEQVAKSLPIGWVLYVKEHQAMLGERDPSFYEEVNKIPNAKMVQINYYKDPKPWIMKARGAVTLLGSTAYEMALLGKKSILFFDMPYSLIEGVTRVHSFEELPEAIGNFAKEGEDNIHSCAAYIEAVKEAGVEIDYFSMMTEGEEILKGKKPMTEEYEKKINALYEFYDKALSRLDKEHPFSP
ncbi:MAG: hypothetical protein HFI78_00105 [Lachnospiraceae bacterium]|nr:hypothetical protein [Lachnospiraceae bacterium]